MKRRFPLLAGVLVFAALSVAAVWGKLYIAAPVSVELVDGQPVNGDGKAGFHALAVNGNLVLCNRTEVDAASGALRADILIPAHARKPILRHVRCTIPGLEFQYCDVGIYGVWWSITIPKLLPVVCVAVALLAWKWGRRCQLRLDNPDPSVIGPGGRAGA